MNSKNKHTFILGTIVLITATMSLIFWGQYKQIWFCDEIYTYESANGFEQDWPSSNIAEWMSGQDVKAFFSADSDNLSLQSISDNLYCDHVPLYFWIFRYLSFFFFKGSSTIWIGLLLNLFFYLVYVGILYSIFCKLTGNPTISTIVVLLTAIVNRVMLEQIMMLRMYIMLLLAEVLLLLAGIWILKDIENKKLNAPPFLFLYSVSLFGLLTHYHYWVFYAITALLFCMWFLIVALKKEKKAIFRSLEFKIALAWSGNFIAALLSTFYLFPYARWNLNRGKGKMALSAVFDFSKKKLELLEWSYERLTAALFGDSFPVFLGLLLLFGCIFGGAIILYKKTEIFKFAGMVLTTFVAWSNHFVVCFTMPAAPEERYLWSSFTILLLCAVWGAILLLQFLCEKLTDYKFGNLTIKVLSTILIIVFFSLQCIIIDGGNGIAYLFHPHKNVNVLEEHHNIPWVVCDSFTTVYSYYDWTIPDRICFLSMDRTDQDINAIQKLENEKKFVLYINQDYCKDMVDFFEKHLQKKLFYKELTTSTNLTVYLLEVVQ